MKPAILILLAIAAAFGWPFALAQRQAHHRQLAEAAARADNAEAAEHRATALAEAATRRATDTDAAIVDLTKRFNVLRLIAESAPPSTPSLPSTPVVEQPKPTPKVYVQIDKSGETMIARDRLIKQAQKNGLFGHVDFSPPDIVEVETTETFANLKFSDKQDLIAVIYGYNFDGTERLAMVILKDIKTHKSLGTYSALRGGLQME